MFGVGAAFDFLAGTKPQAPRWMMRSGMEWAFRFACEPRRLARRYLQTIPLLCRLFPVATAYFPLKLTGVLVEAPALAGGFWT